VFSLKMKNIRKVASARNRTMASHTQASILPLHHSTTSTSHYNMTKHPQCHYFLLLRRIPYLWKHWSTYQTWVSNEKKLLFSNNLIKQPMWDFVTKKCDHSMYSLLMKTPRWKHRSRHFLQTFGKIFSKWSFYQNRIMET